MMNYSDTPVSGIPAEKLLTRARMKLIAQQPFFGVIALRLPLVETDRIPTTAVTRDGLLLFNRKFVNTLDLISATFVVAHEVMHIVQAVFDREPKNAIHQIWNLAADQIINTAIYNADIKCPLLDEVCPESIRKEATKDRITEVRYQNLLKDMKENTQCAACKEIIDTISKGGSFDGDNSNEGQTGKGDQDASGQGNEQGDIGNGGSCSGHSHGKTPHTCKNKTFCYGTGMSGQDDNTSTGEDNFKWKLAVLEARQEAKDRGTSPGSMLEEWLDSLLTPKVDWRQYIRVQASTEFKNRYTYSNFSRRGPALGLRLPGKKPDNRSALVFIDTSGSIGHDMLVRFLSECVGILDACGCESIWIGMHDTEVYFFDKRSKKDITNIEVRAGGTSHLDCFKIVEGKHSKFKLDKKDIAMVICLTDLYSEFPGDCSKPTIWAHPNSDGKTIHVPFGSKVYVDLD
jgi:predicted metal-dependent peptidase